MTLITAFSRIYNIMARQIHAVCIFLLGHGGWHPLRLSMCARASIMRQSETVGNEVALLFL